MEKFSVFLWTELCRVIGTREQVYVRRKWSLTRDEVANQFLPFRQENTIYMGTGSLAEGLCLSGSDIDTMVVDRGISVSPTSGRNLYQPDFIMETENVKPGFVRLRFAINYKFQSSEIPLDTIINNFNLIHIHDKIAYLSNLSNDKFVKISRSQNRNIVSHGPCIAIKSSETVDRDIVGALACRSWPDKASEWIQRHRPNKWPSEELIQNIVNDGCLLVPIGNRNSDLKHIEWRISFTVAEKKLIYSMKHTHVLCYGLLKLYLKHAIEADDAVKDLLCSYFLKTSIFYCIEECDIRWDKENLINCFWKCFERLMSWVRKGHCPNYFIKDNNMFEGKIFGDKQKMLLRRFSKLYSGGINTFVLLPCLSDVICRFQISLVVSRNFQISDTELEGLIDIEIFEESLNEVDETCSAEMLLSWTSAVESQRMSSLLDLELKTLSLDKFIIVLSQKLYQIYVYKSVRNKEKYKYLNMLQNFILHECVGGDICTGWLQYATLCYITGQYSNVIHIVKHVLNKFKPYTVYKGLGMVECNSDVYIHEICGRGYTTLQKAKVTLASVFRIARSCCFYPSEFESEIMHNSLEGLTYIPPVVYSNVLLFLSYKALKNRKFVQYSLNGLFVAAACSSRFITKQERLIAKALFHRCVQLSAP